MVVVRSLAGDEALNLEVEPRGLDIGAKLPGLGERRLARLPIWRELLGAPLSERVFFMVVDG